MRGSIMGKSLLKAWSIKLIIIIVIIILMLISKYEFGTLNPISGGMGFIRIITGDIPFVIIKNNPKIYLAQPETDIIEVLTGYGYKYLPEARMGAILVFEKNGKRYRVHYSVNKYFSKWIFESEIKG